MSERLKEHFRTGALLEHGYAPSGVNLVFPTTVDEKRALVWQDILIQIEALWLDVLDVDRDLYELALPLLQEVRRVSPTDLQRAMGLLPMLTKTIEKRIKTYKYAEEKELGLFLSRMEALTHELEYIVDQYTRALPGMPFIPKSKDAWEADKAKKPGDANLKFVPAGAAVEVGDGDGEENGGEEEEGNEFSNEGQPEDEQGDAEGKNPVFGDDDEEGVSPEAEPFQDPQGVKAPEDELQPEDPNAEPADDAQVTGDDEEEDDEDDDEFRKKFGESVVLKSFERAASSILESISDLDAAYLEAGKALGATMLEHTDVSDAVAQIGHTAPGNPPRVDMFVEWDSGGRPSTCYGHAKLTYVEGYGLLVTDTNDSIVEELALKEKLTDKQVAERVYAALSIVYDSSPQRLFSESRVTYSLQKVLERAGRGEDAAPSVFAQLLSPLRIEIGLNESVRIVPQSINLVLDGPYRYRFEWQRRWASSPASNGTICATEAADEYAESWGTPVLVVDRKAGRVFIESEDGEEEDIDLTQTDESVAARLASMAYQKESLRMRLIEGTVQLDRVTYRSIEESPIHGIERNVGSPGVLAKAHLVGLYQAIVNRNPAAEEAAKGRLSKYVSSDEVEELAAQIRQRKLSYSDLSHVFESMLEAQVDDLGTMVPSTRLPKEAETIPTDNPSFGSGIQTDPDADVE